MATAIWWLGEQQGTYTIVAARYLPASGWQPPLALDVPRLLMRPFRPRVAVNANGWAAAAWSVIPPTPLLRGAVRGNVYTPDLGWGVVETLEESPGYKRTAVTIDGAGNALALWGIQSGCCDPVRVARRPAAGPWNPAMTIGEGGDPVLAGNADGVAFALWNDDDYAVVASRFAPATGWSSPVSIEASQGISIAANDAGEAVAAWTGLQKHQWVVIASRFAPHRDGRPASAAACAARAFVPPPSPSAPTRPRGQGRQPAP